MSKKHIAVLMGGTSSEREVSFSSGAAVVAACKALGFEVTALDYQGSETFETLLKVRPDAVFNALHGSPGEDGIVQAMLEVLQIPYTHSGVMSSALAMDKEKTRQVLAHAGVPVAKGVVTDRKSLREQDPLPKPYVLKPVCGGSSVGVYLVFSEQDKETALKTMDEGAFLCETYIKGRELTCAVLFDHASEVIEIVQNNVFYDYEAKYKEGGSKHILPAKLKPNIYESIQELTYRAHRALGCRGVSRSDFRYDSEADIIVCLEVNTQPGLTKTSLVPELAAYEGLSFEKLIECMIEDASCKR